MEESLKFKHFVPTSSDQQLCTNHFSMLQDLAPADSYMDVIVDKLADGTYRTVINIKAICGKFYSEARELSAIVSVQQAKKSMLATLAEWKQWRF